MPTMSTVCPQMRQTPLRQVQVHKIGQCVGALNSITIAGNNPELCHVIFPALISTLRDSELQTTHGGKRASSENRMPRPIRQPKAVWIVAIAGLTPFMGIGPVNPILPAPKSNLCDPWQR